LGRGFVHNRTTGRCRNRSVKLGRFVQTNAVKATIAVNFEQTRAALFLCWPVGRFPGCFPYPGGQETRNRPR
jgi:hypothetical protein